MTVPVLTFIHEAFQPTNHGTIANFVVSFSNVQIVKFWDYQDFESVKVKCETYYKAKYNLDYKIYRNPKGTEFH